MTERELQQGQEQEFVGYKVEERVIFHRPQYAGGPFDQALSGRAMEEIAREAPKNVAWVSTYNVAEVKTLIDGQTVVLKSERLDPKRFFIDGEVMTVADLEKWHPILKLFGPLERLKALGIRKAIRLRDNSWMEFIDGDTVLSTKSPVRTLDFR